MFVLDHTVIRENSHRAPMPFDMADFRQTRKGYTGMFLPFMTLPVG